MRVHRWGLLIVFGAALFPGRSVAGGPDYWVGATAASRELSQQLAYLQQTFANIPGPPKGRGLFQQTELIQYDLITLRHKLRDRAPREALYLTFDQVQSKVNSLLDDLRGIATWEQSVRMIAPRVRAALDDLHFALSAGDVAPVRITQGTSRQTQLLLNRIDNLESLARFLFEDQPALPGWRADLANLRSALALVQRAERDKAPADEIRRRFLQTDVVWQKLVERFRALPEERYPFLRHALVEVDSVLARLAGLVGVRDRRPALVDVLVPVP